LNYLLRIWEEIRKQAQKVIAQPHLQGARSGYSRVRDYFNPSIKTILVDDKEVYQRSRTFCKSLAPSIDIIVKLYKDKGPIFSKYNLEKPIEAFP